jgi:hypothetical protein
MALGGGTFVTQNKVLPGTYHNFVSASRAFLNLSDRGYVAFPTVASWGPETVVQVTAEDFQKNSLVLFGYDYTHEKLKPLRDIFKGATTVFVRRLALTGATAATNDFATAKYKGVRGNQLSIVITKNVDDTDNFDVFTLLDGVEVDVQRNVESAADLKANEFVTFKPSATLAVTAGTALATGSDGTGADTGTPHQAALEDLEMYGFNVLVCASANATVKSLYMEYTKRMRNEVGAKFQVVVHKADKPDHEGIINVQNDAEGAESQGMVYWVSGASAGVNVNASNTNRLYDGEFVPSMAETNTQTKLVTLIEAGKFAFHRVGEDIRVLRDINSFTSFTVDKNEDFSANQVIRVIDQIAIDTANIFNTRYLGKVPNDADGRISLWNDILTHRLELQRLRAIQDYDSKKLTIAQGNAKNSVVANEEVNVTWAMEKLYITTVVA